MDSQVIFSKLVALYKTVDTSLKNNSYVFSKPEAEIRLKPPPNLPVNMIRNHISTIGFVEKKCVVLKDWKWANNVRLRLEDGEKTIIQKTQVGNAFRFNTNTGWGGRVVVSTETNCEQPPMTPTYYREVTRVSYTQHDERFAIDLSFNDLLTEVEIEILDTCIEPVDIGLLVTSICCS